MASKSIPYHKHTVVDGGIEHLEYPHPQASTSVLLLEAWGRGYIWSYIFKYSFTDPTSIAARLTGAEGVCHSQNAVNKDMSNLHLAGFVNDLPSSALLLVIPPIFTTHRTNSGSICAVIVTSEVNEDGYLAVTFYMSAFDGAAVLSLEALNAAVDVSVHVLIVSSIPMANIGLLQSLAFAALPFVEAQ